MFNSQLLFWTLKRQIRSGQMTSVYFIALYSTYSWLKGKILKQNKDSKSNWVKLSVVLYGLVRKSSLSYLSAIESGHLRVSWGGTAHTSLPPPAPAAAGEDSLWSQSRAEAIHGHMLIQQTAERDIQAEAVSRKDEIYLYNHAVLEERKCNIYTKHCLAC